MNLRLDSLQTQLARSVRAVLSGDGDPWRQLADLDVLRFGVPVDRDGMEFGLTAQVIVDLELGLAMRSLPGYRDTVVALRVLTAAPPSDLTDVLDGRHRLAALGLWGSAPLRLDRDGLLWGQGATIQASTWDGAVVLAERDGEEVFVRAPIGRLDPVDTLAGPGMIPVFDGTGGAVVLDIKDVTGTAARVRAEARVLHAGFLCGLSEATLAAVRDRAHTREQFSRKLIDFQTVSHRLAVLAGELDAVDLLVHFAAWRCEEDPDPGPAPAQALASAAEVATRSARLAIQLHGARGMLANSVTERAYRLATAEGLRMGRPADLWLEAGRLRWDAA